MIRSVPLWLFATLPNYKNKKPWRNFEFYNHVILLFKDISPILFAKGYEFTYKYALIVINDELKSPVYIVTMHSSKYHRNVLRVYEEDSHHDFGSMGHFVSEEDFLQEGMRLIKNKFGSSMIIEET